MKRKSMKDLSANIVQKLIHVCQRTIRIVTTRSGGNGYLTMKDFIIGQEVRG
jgi:hypothetical protein